MMGGPGSGRPGVRKGDVVCFRPTPAMLAWIDSQKGALSRGEFVRALLVERMR